MVSSGFTKMEAEHEKAQSFRRTVAQNRLDDEESTAKKEAAEALKKIEEVRQKKVALQDAQKEKQENREYLKTLVTTSNSESEKNIKSFTKVSSRLGSASLELPVS